MIKVPRGAIGIALALAVAPALAADPVAPAPSSPQRTMSEVLAATTPADWRTLDPENTLYLQLPQGRVVIELAAAFAPQHADNLRRLARGKYFDGLAIVRSQDNFVVQWGDPDGKRSLGTARATLAPEFTVPLRTGLPFTRLRRAIRDKRRVALHYADEGGRESERKVRPLALAFHPPAWLLISWCELRSDFRNFRLDRIASCEATAECFADEPGKSLADYLRRLEQELSDPSAGGRSQSP